MSKSKPNPSHKKNPTARIKARESYSPYALRVTQTSKGVFWDVEDTGDKSRRFIISTRPRSARRLAEWILENIQDERSSD